MATGQPWGTVRKRRPIVDFAVPGFLMKLTLSFPGPVRLHLTVAAAALLMVLQMATGTALEFAELTFIAIIFAVVVVNLTGGIRTVAGCCLAIVALQVFVIAEIGKVWFGEPGQTRLEEPF